MITEKEGETRIQYLMRVLDEYMIENGCSTIEFDGTTCDGWCLADDIRNELDSLGLLEQNNER